MKGDFTRNTFDPFRHFSRVLMQQGRVQLDADFNEQTAILLHYLRTLASDLAGPYWGPADSDKRDFLIGNLTADNNGDFTIGKGHYYVDGILCENDDAKLTYRTQAGFKEAPLPNRDKAYYVYLDVWERHITPIQDDRIREVALGGPDTYTRAQVIWQVRLAESTKEAPNCTEAAAWVKTLREHLKPMMRARVLPEYEDNNACSIPPESRYRGPENQLYRIEVHRGGVAWNGQTNSKDGTPAGNHECAATFKWSRDNGSVVFPIVRQQGEVVTLQTLGQDRRTRLQVDDWVEIIDDDLELRGEPGILAQVYVIDPVELTVKLKLPDDLTAVSCPPGAYDQPRTDRVSLPSYDENSRNHPLLRRWDQRAAEGLAMSQGAILIRESALPEEGWIEIEDGVEVQFQSPVDATPRVYHTGDYWLVPARVATGKIEWPLKLDDKGAVVRDSQGNEEPDALLPHGIKHYYAPLAVINNGAPTDCRCFVKITLECPSTA